MNMQWNSQGDYNRWKGRLYGGIACIGLGAVLGWGLFTWWGSVRSEALGIIGGVIGGIAGIALLIKLRK